VWQRAAKLTPPAIRPLLKRIAEKPRAAVAVSHQDREFLQRYYRDEIRKLEALLGRDLGAWLQ
jgi:hypothetical protein